MPRLTFSISSRVKGQGHQAAKRRGRKSPVSSALEGLRTSYLVYGIQMQYE